MELVRFTKKHFTLEAWNDLGIDFPFNLNHKVIYNFDGTALSCSDTISAYLGEPVIIRGECKQWFYVRKFELDDGGIIPKSYVRILDCTVIRNGYGRLL